jgi:preprotein translocase subunit YajC
VELFPLIVIVIAFVLLIVLPARQRKSMQAKQQALQASLTVGTPIMMTSGMYGTVAGLGEGTVDVEVAPGVVVTFVRAAVLEVRTPAAVQDEVAGPADGPAPYADGDGDPTDRTR